MSKSLSRWDPFTELAELRSRFDRVLTDVSGDHEHRWTPAMDVERRNGDLVLRADLPGIKPEDVSIKIEDDVLTVSGMHTEEHEEKERDFVRRERRTGSFSRTMVLPGGVDAAKIKATTHDGVLEVTIPLPQEGKRDAIEITPTAA